MANHIHCRRVVGSHRGHSSSTTPRPRVCGWGSARSTARRSPRGRPPGPGGRSGTAPSRPRRTLSVSPFPALSHFARVDHSPSETKASPSSLLSRTFFSCPPLPPDADCRPPPQQHAGQRRCRRRTHFSAYDPPPRSLRRQKSPAPAPMLLVFRGASGFGFRVCVTLLW